ncbi:chemotaxis protein methyltransferase CheR [Jatrophihabitans endophyticus]|uniref:protein-glutamate O-methyltransferase n=1 Tax=Jatrophihabitans endophyticus TaxID=1206085 RepID=A0A1M5IIB3_9ACTN|nr:protein-glutamate O-methyltransferase CheR [Jatrophihabitans endophyticus]SHG28042.1 chemotaxis protein methyltransferase CheR [Jatrophihabitans endophyticus]
MTLTTENFDYVREMVHRDSAIVLAPGKEYLVEARLTPLARSSGATTVDDFVARIRVARDLAMRAKVIDALTTNETSWYRDGDPFTALRNTVLPEIVGRPGFDGTVRIWSAACSSGQEPYTIAMEIADMASGRPLNASILATDLSPTMVERTKAGRYSQLEVNRGMPATRLVQHFTREGTEWVVSSRLRSMVRTQTMNLASPFGAIGKFDVVFLRNVLIYFDVPTKRQILQRVRAVMRPNAYLFLGSAEVTIGVDDGWRRSAAGRSSFYQPATGA